MNNSSLRLRKKDKKMIVTQANELAEKNHWVIDLDEDLLEEVNNLVEYPTVFSGDFEENIFLFLKKLLSHFMKEHQRYFEVRNDQGMLLLIYFCS